MRILVIHGANLNMLGLREPHIYGNDTLEDLNDKIFESFADSNISIDFFQSNCEGELINKIHLAREYDGLVINPGAYTHYSYAILDALKCINTLKVEVHLSNILEREEFRRHSVTKDGCNAFFYGEGVNSYIKGINYIIGELNNG